MRRLLTVLLVGTFPFSGFAGDVKTGPPKAEKPKSAKDKKSDPDEIGNRNVSRGPNMYSIEQEIALGKALAQDVMRQAKVVDDDIIAELVNRVVQNIVRNSDAKVPFNVKVIEDETINAFAFPGGYLFVNTGLIDKCDNEAEFAAALAHEIAHVAARHGTRQATRERLASVATIPLIFMGGWGGFGARQASGILVPMGMLKFSRGMEQEADDLGLQYMYKTGYDPGAFVDFFERLQAMQKQKSKKIADVFSTHPMNDVRIRNAQKNIQQNLKPRPEYVLTTSEFKDVKDRLYRLENRHKVDQQDLNGPTLKKRPGAGTNGDTDSNGGDDDRPTLKKGRELGVA